MDAQFINLPDDIIDPHCHGRDMEESHKTTVAQVLSEARSANISTTIFMPNTKEPIITIATLNKYLVLINKACMELGITKKQYVYFGLTDNNINECAIALKDPLVIGLKVYPSGNVTTGSIGVSNIPTILKAMELVKNANKVIAFHCDDPLIISREGNTINAETSYVSRIIKLGEMIPEVKILICHVSCKDSAEIIIESQKLGMQIAIEIAPHYLWFDNNETNWNPVIDQIFYHCFNNLRAREHRLYLHNLISKENPLVIIGSDSASHTENEKLRLKLGGIPTNQEMVPVIITLAKQIGLSDQQVANLLSLNASKFFGIPVSKKIIRTRIEKRIDNIQYNNGVVLNPWNGSELLFPMKEAS